MNGVRNDSQSVWCRGTVWKRPRVECCGCMEHRPPRMECCGREVVEQSVTRSSKYYVQHTTFRKQGTRIGFASDCVYQSIGDVDELGRGVEGRCTATSSRLSVPPLHSRLSPHKVMRIQENAVSRQADWQVSRFSSHPCIQPSWCLLHHPPLFPRSPHLPHSSHSSNLRLSS